MRVLLLFLIFIMVLPTISVADEWSLPDPEFESPISAEEVTRLFRGQIHRGSYHFQNPKFEGFHFEELTAADGRVIHRLGSRIDTGSWQQNGNKICFDYDSPDLLGACFTFYQRGNCIYHHQETVQGQMAPRFTAVSVIKGETPNCEPAVA